MRNKLVKYLSIAALSVVLLFAGLSMAASNPSSASASVSVSAATATTDNGVSETSPGQNVVADPGVLEQFGPPGVIITTVLTGVLMIVRNINEGKKIDVTTYKERAADAELRSNEEIGKVHKKLDDLEKKLDEVIKDRDEYRDTLEDRKAQYTQQIIDMEKRHQREIEDQHAALVIEIHVRHKLERILAEKGIPIPETPPPYTKAMKQAVTPRDEEQADTNTASMKIIREYEE